MSKGYPARCFSLVFAAATVSLALIASPLRAENAPPIKDVLDTYANIAEATYGDSFKAAQALKTSVDALIKAPSDETLAAARAAWIAARVPYMQTEAFRFGNPIVDDWEGRVNSWPLDEGLIDYVAEAYGSDNPENEFYAANVIANKSLKIAGKTVDTSKITPELIRDTLNEAGGVEANVASGYHAIEFLLWGQDLNGTEAGAGNRPATDYDLKACTGGNCDRRAAYLSTVTQMLVDDLDWMTKQWGAKGEARAFATHDEKVGLTAIFTGLGSLSYGELAGERMKLGLMIHDPEEEHDCFSDNTHASHYGDVVGIQNVYLAHYKRLDGSVVSGPSVSDLVKAKSAETDARVKAAIDKTLGKMTALVERAKTVEAYDQMIGLENTEGNAVVQTAIDALIAQAKEFERAIATLDLKDIKFEGSDSLDHPDKVDGPK
ncbi:imelysin family protein [Hyphomicrobium sp. LHD-15]|uniref:imelysin family protein n=1 Tax=Hyphomicrobium sp. LHD-15 TaxID=3072142 RepID=UPI0028108ACB|nr:imelysin family protein [Hyphomicrobium sp. LHD-15]MDQ8698085.1 imelysin family protein [Hyphomicrobium sp. LHD-15]